MPAHAAREMERFRGREIQSAGEKTMAIFDGPARAIRCAAALTEYARRLGFPIRAGLHTGEVEIRDGSGISGAAVDVCIEIAATAAAGEVLVSGTVKDLVAGSGIRFEETASVIANGDWRLHAVAR